jgi:hypothetical protein
VAATTELTSPVLFNILIASHSSKSWCHDCERKSRGHIRDLPRMQQATGGDARGDRASR